MIQANVCAAETLEQRRTPLIYRVHDDAERREDPGAGRLPRHARHRLEQGPGADHRRASTAARPDPRRPARRDRQRGGAAQPDAGDYDAENIGHFGLNLRRYAHFTSPIRRYADLIVHRALIRALGLGDDGLPTTRTPASLGETAERITAAERRAMAAERDATDRLIAAFLADRVGAKFEGRITGVTRFGLFVRLDETGADGLVPVSTLGGEYFHHDERAHALVGESTRRDLSARRYRDGAARRGHPVAGALLFEMLSRRREAARRRRRPILGRKPWRRGAPHTQRRARA